MATPRCRLCCLLQSPRGIALHSFHDHLVFARVLVAIVHRGDAALFVILDPVHRVRAEAHLRDRRAMSSSQVMNDCSLTSEPRADRAHGSVEAGDGTVASGGKHEAGMSPLCGNDVLNALRQPYAMVLLGLGAGPPHRGYLRAGQVPPPSVFINVLPPHAADFALSLTSEQQDLERTATDGIEISQILSRMPRSRCRSRPWSERSSWFG